MNGKISNLIEVASLRRYTLTEGSERGLEVIDCDNGRIRFLLNVSKACDVMQLYHRGVNVSFVSKNGFSPRELPFLDRFEGGMLYTCGLDSVGGRDGFEIHGSLHNNPARITRAECTKEGIFVEAVVKSTSLFGKNLTLIRKIESKIGADTLSIKDTVQNDGFSSENYALLYHINIGYPMLDEGARVLLAEKECTPRTPWSAERLETRYFVSDAVPTEEETCYFLNLKEPKAELINEKLGKSLSVSYSGDTLPHFIEWRSMGSGDYALGFEPATTLLDDKFACRTLGPAEKVEFSIEISVRDI